MSNKTQRYALILAGGEGRRMGNKDKGSIRVEGLSLIERVIERLKPQVDEIFINCRKPENYQKLGWQLIGDEPFPSEGPLCGIAAGLQQIPGNRLLITPCDAPQVPLDLAERLEAAMNKTQTPLACIKSGQRVQPLFSMIDKSLEPALSKAVQEGERKVEKWLRTQNALFVEDERGELYLNLNSPEELARYQKQIQAH